MSEGTAPTVLPEVTDATRHFWQGGRDGHLLILRCTACGYYVHPPIPVCPRDQSKDLAPVPVSGRGRVASYTVNHHPWLPGFDPPYVVALVELDEQVGLRLTTNVVHCPPETVAIGQRVAVTFCHVEDPNGDLWLPLFEPDTDDTDHTDGSAGGG